MTDPEIQKAVTQLIHIATDPHTPDNVRINAIVTFLARVLRFKK